MKKLNAIPLLFLTLFLIFADGGTKGQIYTGRFFPDPKIKASSYNAFSMDKEGFIWIGTNNGLIRFDGNNYDTYRHDENKKGSLSDNRILNILCDSKGRIWVGTANGLNLYNPFTDSFTLIDLPSIDINGYIIDSAEQSDGTVTFLVSRIGMFIIDDSKDVPAVVRELSTYPAASDFNTLLPAYNRLFIGDGNGNVFGLEKNGNIANLFNAGAYILEMRHEGTGSLLIATVSDIYRYNPFTKESVKITIPEEIEITSLSENRDGKIYIATKDSGIWELSSDSDRIKKSNEIQSSYFDMENARISSIYSSPDGNLWIGCNHYGVMVIPGREMPFYYRQFSKIDGKLNGLLETMQNWKDYLLIGMDNGKLALLSSVGEPFFIQDIPGDDAISSIKVEENKAYIGVANKGVWEMDLPTGNMKQHLNIPGKYPNVIIGPSVGDDTYIAIHSIGIYRHNHKDGTLEIISKNSDGEDIVNPYVNTLSLQGDKLWIGHYNGFDSYDINKKEFNLQKDESLTGMTVFSIELESDKLLLLGTSNGLIHYYPESGEYEKFTTTEGLTDNNIKSIAIDNKGRRWIATMHGLSLQHPEDNSLVSYYGGHGLVDNEFNSIIPDNSGNKIYLGSSLGISCFEADSIPLPNLVKSPSISAVMLNGKRITGESENGVHTILPGKDEEPYRISLPYKDNAITLRLSMMDFRNPSNLIYMWRFGDEGEWNRLPSGDDLIYFSFLEPRLHHIQIRAEENNSVSPITEILIKVRPPWYLTIWAKIIYVLILITLCVSVWVIQKKKRQEKINDEKIKYFIDVSHDIRSPITLILDPLETLMKQQFDPEIKSKFRLMHRNALRIINLVNQMLDIRKLEKGKLHLSCKLTNFNDFVEELVGMFSEQAKERGLSLTFHSEAHFPSIWLDRDNFDKILMNLISNSIKYTHSGGSIEVRISKVNDKELGECAELSVIDTGIGLDEKTEKFMFERFYRASDIIPPSADGVGIGLDLCRRLSILHHGTISGFNRKDGVRGSVFSVRIPLDPDRYEESEKKASSMSVADNISRYRIHQEIHPDEKLLATKKRPRTAASGSLLIVDDDSELRNYLKEKFSPQFVIEEADNGVEALKLIQVKHPDIIISDVIMPQMDGLGLLRQLKGNAQTSHIPVILLSSRNDIADRMTAWDKGADAYLSKPFHLDELYALVDNLIFNRLRIKGKYSGTQDTAQLIEAPQIKGNDQTLIERILKVTREHVDDSDFNVENLSSEVGISRAHLHRKMKELMGLTPVDFIRNVRLRRACQLLKNTDIEVTQVAYTLGYGSQSHFSTTFKRFTGYTPTEYREKCLSGELLPEYGTEIENSNI